LNVTKQYHS